MPGLQIKAVSTILDSVQAVGKSLNFLNRGPTINRLPESVLSEILLYVTCPSDVEQAMWENGKARRAERIAKFSPVMSLHIQSTPFDISQVCQLWRRILIRNGAFWRSITIIRPNRLHVFRVKLWVERVHRHSLDFEVIQSKQSSQEENEVFTMILRILATKIQQWRNIALNFQHHIPPLFIQLSTKLSDLVFPMLRDATVSVNTGNIQMEDERLIEVDGEHPVATIWKSFHSIRTLRRFVFDSEYVPSMPIGPHIRELVLPKPVTMHQIQCLAHLRRNNLQSLHISIRKGDDTEQSIDGNVDESHDIIRKPLVRLRQLIISAEQSDALAAFFKYFSFPSLVALETIGITKSDCDALWDAVRYSKCALRILSLSLINVPSTIVLDWFDLPIFQDVETLVLSGVSISDEVLLQLHCPPLRGTKPLYFPCLKHLGLIKCHPNIDHDHLIRMLGSRYWIFPRVDDETGMIRGDLEPYLKTELRTAMVCVERKTEKMTAYERVINECARRMMDIAKRRFVWDDRRLSIVEA